MNFFMVCREAQTDSNPSIKYSTKTAIYNASVSLQCVFCIHVFYTFSSQLDLLFTLEALINTLSTLKHFANSKIKHILK